MEGFWKKLTIALSVVIGIPCLLMVFGPLVVDRIDYWRIKLPATRDLRLVGKWQGAWKFLDEPEPRSRTTILRPDGVGECWDGDRLMTGFSWGTESGVLYTRRMAVDAWSATSHAYAIGPNGRSIEFAKVRMFDLVAQMMDLR